MSRLIYVFLACLLLINLYSSLEVKDVHGVLQLDDKNFEEASQNYPTLLIRFYSPYCALSKKLSPEFILAGSKLKRENPNIYIGEVNGTANPELYRKFKINGYPTIILLTLGNHPVEYSGGRTEKDIVSWMKKNTGNPSTELANTEEVAAFIEANQIVSIAFDLEKTTYDNYLIIAKENIEVEFAHCNFYDCQSVYNAKQGEIKLFKKYDEKENTFSEEFTLEGFKQFLHTYSFKLVYQFDTKVAELIFGKDNPGLFFYLDKKGNQETNSRLEKLATDVAKKLRGKIIVVVTGIHEDIEQKLIKYTKVDPKEVPTVRIQDTRSKLKSYLLKNEITEENIVELVENWTNGMLGSIIKSEEIPASNDGPIKIIVGNSYKDLVLNGDKNIFVMFYDSTSINFSKIAPIWLELSKEMNGTNTTIGMMDIKFNEIDNESFEKVNLPLFKLWRQGEKNKPLYYTGEHTVDGFKGFLLEYSILISKSDGNEQGKVEL